MKTKLLVWEQDDPVALTARHDNGTVYRIVFSYGYHCLRHEVPGQPFRWMGQFATLAQAKLMAQDDYDAGRRLKSWQKYMASHDPPDHSPPSPPVDPDWPQTETV